MMKSPLPSSKTSRRHKHKYTNKQCSFCQRDECNIIPNEAHSMPPQLKILFPDFLFFHRSLCKPSLKYATEPKTLIHCYMKISPRQNISGCNARLLCKQVGKTKTDKTLSWRNTKRFCILKIIDAFQFHPSREDCKTMFAAVKLRNIILLSAVTKRRWTPELPPVNFPRLSLLIKRQKKVL